MDGPEKGFVYGFTSEDFHRLKTLSFAQHFHSVAEAGRREYEQLLQGFANNPDVPRPEPRSVKMRAFRVDNRSPFLFSQLKKHFPQYVVLFLVNETVHEMFKRTEKFNFVGTIPMTLMTEPPVEILKADFWAFEQPTNQHLFVD